MIENTVYDIVTVGSGAVLLQNWFWHVTAALPEPGRLVVLTENFPTLSSLLVFLFPVFQALCPCSFPLIGQTLGWLSMCRAGIQCLTVPWSQQASGCQRPYLYSCLSQLCHLRMHSPGSPFPSALILKS